jgi:ABC-type multidrug transport system fused ATPase/permease subunit
MPKVLVESKQMIVNNEQAIILHYKCIEQCPNNYAIIFNRCFNAANGNSSSDVANLISDELLIQVKYIAMVCLVAFVFSYITLILFRYAIKYIIWIINISFVVVLICGVIACLMYKMLEMALLLLVFVVVSITLLYWYRQRIQLVAKLFKEASKALIDIPGILFEPILVG